MMDIRCAAKEIPCVVKGIPYGDQCDTRSENEMKRVIEKSLAPPEGAD
jgi:hypothetical protein